MDARKPTVLLVDDSPDIRESVGDYLRSQGLNVLLASDAAGARAALSTGKPDLVLLDIMMPGEDGLSLCRWIAANRGPAVILLTARTDTSDKVDGLELGADDFITKPCDPRELLARVRSVLRRTAPQAPVQQRRRIANMLHDAQLKRLICDDGGLIRLTSGENRLLLALLDQAGQTVSRNDLTPLVTGREAHAFDRAIDNAISRLRRKIEIDADDPRLIITERGGYRLVVTPPDAP